MASRKKPVVGFVYSASSKSTTSGEDLAIYFGACLQIGGYSDVRIIGFDARDSYASTASRRRPLGKNSYSDGTANVRRSSKFAVVPYGGKKPVYPNHVECCREGWESVAGCNVVLMCVDPADTSACAAALSKAVKKGSDAAIISFDLGVRNHSTVEEHLDSHGVILLGAAVGIHIARSLVDGHLRCLGDGCLVVERLAKAQSKKGVKFIDLLRTSGISFRHCKNVSSYTHGAMVFNTVHAVAALAGIPLLDLLRDRHARLLWAAMIREGLEVLALAAGGGDWRAANPCCSLTLPQLELFLCLPTHVFALLSRLVLHFPPGFEPAMQMDLNIGRDTAVDWTLGEIVRLGDKHEVKTPVCRALLSEVKLRVSTGDGVPCLPPSALPCAAMLASKGSDSARALKRKVLIWCCSITFGTALIWILGGFKIAVTGMLAVFLLVLCKFAIVGDTVP